MNIVKEVANSIDPMINFTVDVPSDNDDGKVPMLDVKVWIDNDDNQVNYIFYQKPMKNRRVTMKSSAMPYRQKITVLSQEVFRRLHNTKHELHEKFKNEILNEFMIDLKISGYNQKERLNILKSGFKTYDNLTEKVKKEERPFYRPKNFQKHERKRNKRSKKYNWFRSDKKFTSVMFVKPTPNSQLLKMLQKTESIHKIDQNCRIKFVEKSGQKIIEKLKKSDPFASKCPKSDCLPCVSSDNDGNTSCRKSNVTYKMQCNICKKDGIEKSYSGETSRNAYIRGREHQKLFKNKNKNSFMWKHAVTEHSQERNLVTFDMKITGKFSSPLRRQIFEGVSIKNQSQDENLNSKSEFHGPSVIRRTVEGQNFNCNLCQYSCRSENNLKTHKKMKHEASLYKCDQCNIVLTLPSDLRNHMRTTHVANNLNCDLCDDSHESVENLKNHKIIHQKAENVRKPVQCDICQYESNSIDNLMIHKSGEHKPIQNTEVCEFENVMTGQVTGDRLEVTGDR